jgi:phytoene synthase
LATFWESDLTAMRLDRRRRLTPDLAELLPRKARTFALAARFLPPPQRTATVTLYAFCRFMDDLVDEPPLDLREDEIRGWLGAWRRWLQDGWQHREPPEPVALGLALREVIAEHDMPIVYLTQLLDGLESDLGPVQPSDFVALRQYCYLVAGTVGLAMTHVLGCQRPEALAAAADLGIAMQLTNVLRDLGADLRAGRCYLPADELAHFGYTPARLQALARNQPETGQPDQAFRALLRFQIERARGYYARGLAGVWLLPSEVRPAILVAGRLYRAILGAIEASGYDVLRRRAVVSRRVKAYESIAALMLVRLWGNSTVPEVLDPPLEWLAEPARMSERLVETAR